jgi:acyl-CoA thioesterase FadM
MTVIHHCEIHSDASVHGQTWLRDFRRGLLTRRQVHLLDGDTLLAEATQSWVHVGEIEGQLRPMRAPDGLIAAFPVHPEPGGITRLREWQHIEPMDLPDFELELWHGWMDPLGHANHPAYIDWCDEALCRALVDGGHDPTLLVAAGEQVRWRRPALARDRVTVRSRLVGRSARGLVIRHELINLQHGQTHATAMTQRHLLGDPGGSSLERCLRERFA